MTPLEEAIILWERITETGESKIGAIIYLHDIGKLANSYYTCACPLCHAYIHSDACIKCPWPKYNGSAKSLRCCTSESPYNKWLIQDDKESAQEVLNLLKSLKGK